MLDDLDQSVSGIHQHRLAPQNGVIGQCVAQPDRTEDGKAFIVCLVLKTGNLVSIFKDLTILRDLHWARGSSLFEYMDFS